MMWQVLVAKVNTLVWFLSASLSFVQVRSGIVKVPDAMLIQAAFGLLSGFVGFA